MSLCFCLYLLCIFITLVTSNSVTDRIDFERDCNVQLNIYDSTVAQVFAYPILGGVVTDPISRCEAKFVAPSNRKIRIYIDEFTLGGGACGHKLKIYDGPLQNDPKWELGCNTVNQNLYTSSRNEVIIAFTKPSADSSQLYKFSLRITTDQGETNLYFKPIKKPDFSIVQLFKALKMPAYQFLQHRQRRDTVNQPSYTAPMTGGTGGGDGGGISSGAIAGIAVGCVVGAVIIIAICIYALWRFMRQSEEKKRYGAQEPPPVFVTSSAPVSNCGIAPGSSRRSFRSQSHVAFSEISKKDSSSDSASKSRSKKSFENHGYDGTSVSSVQTRSDFTKDSSTFERKPLKDDKDEFKRTGSVRRSYKKDRADDKINYPDVVNSARKSEKDKQIDSSFDSDNKERKRRGDSIRKTNKLENERLDKGDEKFRERTESVGKDKTRKSSTRHKSVDDYRSDEKGEERNRKQRESRDDKYRSERKRYKTESVFTDDSGATQLSSVSSRQHDKRGRSGDRYGSERRHRDDRYDDRRQKDRRYPDERYDDRYDEHKHRERNSERGSSQRRRRTESQGRYVDDYDDRDIDPRRSRGGHDPSNRHRSHSTSRAHSSHHDRYDDRDRYREDYRSDRDRYDEERHHAPRRRESSRSNNGSRQRSRSSYR